MRDILTKSGEQEQLGKWGLATAIGLLAVAFVVERMAPPEDAAQLSRRSPAPPARADARVGEDGRGRHAASPSEIPAKGWKDILLRVYNNISEHRIMALAAGMTYYSILAIFPAIAALVAVYGLFSDPMTISKHLDQLGGFLPGGALDVAREQMTRVASKGSNTLGVTFLIGLATSLWSANAAMKSLFDTMNIVHGEDEKRGFFKLNAVSLAFTLGGILFIIAALGSIVAVPVLLNYVGLSNSGDLLLRIGRWPAMFVVLTLALAVIYRYGPSREAAQWRWVTWGSAIAALLWLAVSGLFSWYAASFGKFNETYGSLGAIVGFMTWLWISAIVVLLGAEIDAEMEHQTARDTTTGPPDRIGARGARVADTVGAAQGS
ncbi:MULTISPECIES: YihY/virulence factor BrkB family protein [unclassified Bradyrhizobium]|uniref:YihY/virulence factor BrkB family protein n=1 Tax=unclassified Bradyrhizobium TaxID=2631580 RepID=UPI0020B2AB5A|nr:MULTISPECIES: YihY/virulence factor BrkB family protein [unclassified Bradyrhizobium]MCP3402004.1 YihY/virulence factor BrkB family protein [Bradyrhizobium sp. CCGB20]MCP3410489.1 YihY/virulence factor BrkB family protein [Bradyrhizobium sp. CCGB01]